MRTLDELRQWAEVFVYYSGTVQEEHYKPFTIDEREIIKRMEEKLRERTTTTG